MNKTGKALSLLLSLALVLGFLPWTALTARAEGPDKWDGTVATGFAGGDGTEEDPYEIATGAQLAYLAQQVNAGNAYSGEYFVLTSDLDLGGIDEDGKGVEANKWTPIGFYTMNISCYFDGIFDGGNHAVSGLYVNVSEENRDVFGGLFGVVGANRDAKCVLKNLRVSGVVTVETTRTEDSASNCYANAGGVVCEAMGGVTVSNCESSVTVTSTANNGCAYAGGVAEYVEGNVTGCTYSGVVYSDVVTTTASRASVRVGGVVSYVESGEVTDCHVSGGAVTATATGGLSSVYVGGVVSAFAAGKVEGCTATDTEVTATATGADSVYAGGVTGRGNTMNDCHFTNGNITATATDGSAWAGGVATSGRTVTGCTVTNAAVTATATATGENSQSAAYAGGVIANPTTGSSGVSGELTGCSTVDTTVSSTADYAAYAGGIAGHTLSIDLSRCVSSGTVAAKAVENDNYYNTYAGGVVGFCLYGTVSDCVSTAAVTANRVARAGGIAGWCKECPVTRCDHSGTVTASNVITESSGVGGVVGCARSDVARCTHIGAVTATAESGVNFNAGGIVGLRDAVCSVTDCRQYGDVTAVSTGLTSAAAGGVVGRSSGYSGSITGCYHSGNVTAKGGKAVAGGIAVTAYGEISDCHHSGGNVAAVGLPSTKMPDLIIAGGVVAGVNNGSVSNCTSSGDVTVVNVAESGQTVTSAGGVAGTVLFDSVITNCCHFGGAVSAQSPLGSDEQCADGYGITCAGGVVGGMGVYGGYVTDRGVVGCYHYGGAVTATTENNVANYVGGVVGWKKDFTVRECYYLEGAAEAGAGYVTGGTTEAFALTADEFRQLGSFYEQGSESKTWDFDTVWVMGAKRPLLRATIALEGKWEGGKLTAEVTAPEDALLLAAAYDETGRQLSIRVIEVKAGKAEYDAGFALADGHPCKLMLVDRETFVPYCKAWDSEELQ